MAQRIVHYLIGERLIAEWIQDPDRFRIGNLLPDAYPEDIPRRVTHFTKIFQNDEGNEIRYCDFEEFRRRYAKEIECDDLYLGYYIHLVADACYRVFWQRVHVSKQKETNISYLHSDYHLLNRYLAERYGLVNKTVYPADFENERIREICPFCLNEFLEEFRGDFQDPAKGEMRYLTEGLVEEYLQEGIPVCLEALQRIRTQGEPLASLTMTW